MTFDELVDCLKNAKHGDLRRIERETGVNYGTIREIKDGQTKNPRIDTFNSLCAWFQREPPADDPAPARGPLDPDAITGLAIDEARP